MHIRGAGLLAAIDLAGGAAQPLIAHLQFTATTSIHVLRLINELDIEIVPNDPVNGAPVESSTVPLRASNASQSSITIPLKYADLSEAAEVLTGQAPTEPNDGIPTQSILGQALPSGGQFGGTPAYSSTVGAMQPSVQGGTPESLAMNQVSQRINEHVAIDRRLNALILSGTPYEIEGMLQMIKQFDVPDSPKASVLLDTEIVELTDTAARDVGINFANNNSIGGVTLDSRTASQPTLELTLQAQVFAEIAKGHGKLIAKPRIQTLSGTAASILTGDALPIITTITYPGSPPTVQQQLQYVNVGVHLQIQPYAAATGFVTSRIIAEVSNVTGFIQGNIPQISQRQAIATARVRDGQAYVIGGLLQDNEIDSMSKLPLLGSIPVLGSLFKTIHNTHQKTNLYVIVIPHIVQAQP